jgi:predicted ATP-grasp superfamily ATP-dependent carboligase
MNILVIGVNTRPVVNSAKKLGYNVYSVSYYNPIDMHADEKKYIVNDNYHGHFKNNYNENDLLNLANHYVDDMDYVFICSGIFENENSKTPNWSVVGNSPKKIKRISNKYYITKKLDNLGYNIPTTYIANNSIQLEKYLYDLKSAVIKPKYGSGGIGIYSLDLESMESNINIDNMFNYLKNLKFPVMVQEMIKSDSYSASFIGSNFVCYNKQIIVNNMYVGNITPYIPKSLENNQKVINSFKEVIESFDLEGMNGIDFMIKDNVPVILEINPRILGTFETIELSSNDNIVKSLIENKPTLPKTKYIKRILFAEQKLISNIKKQQNIFDIPKYGAIIEKNEPLTTVIGRDYGEINNAIDSISNMVIMYENK